MSRRLLLRRAVLGCAVAAAFSFAVPALASAAESIALTPCNLITCTPQNSTFTAGGDSSVTATITGLAPGGANGNVNTITTQLGAGVLANLSSSTALGCISSGNTSPDTNASCIIGGGSSTPIGTFVAYLTPPNTLTTAPPGTVLAGLDLVSTAPPLVIHGDLSLQQLGGGQLVGILTSDLSTATGLNSVITGITLNLNGQLPGGAALTAMPTACTLATPTQLSVTYVSGSAGPTAATSDVNVSSTCGSLNYTPSLAGSATKDSGDSGAAVVTTLTQPAGQSANAALSLSVPTSVLAPNAAALALANTTTPVGTVSATSPLLPLPLTGHAFLTSGGSGLGLSLRFTSPFPFTLNGSVSLSGSVSFATVPDVPIASLGVALSGGPQALFIAPCALTSGTLSVSATAQNGKTASPTSTFSVSGCPSGGPPPTVGKPTASGGSLTGLSSGHPKLHFKVTHGSNAPNIKSVSVGVPAGLSFHTTKTCKGKGKKRHCTTSVKGLSVSGGTVKSAKVSGGRLVITLKSATGSVSVTVKGPGLTESNGLKQKVKKHKVKSLTVNVKVTDASGTGTTLSLKLSV
jgi:hypothetical protein